MANRPLDFGKGSTKQKPLLWADYDPTAYDPDVWEQRSTDPSRIPGYSEIVQANDVAKVDDFLFQQRQREFGISDSRFWNKEAVYRMIGAHPQELPVEFRWLPISNPGGGPLSPDQARQIDHYVNREGFRLVTVKDEADFRQQFGYDFPPTAHVEADGSIRRGVDLALYARPGDVARKWERKRKQMAAEADAPNLPETLSAGDEATETFRTETQEGHVDLAKR
jgi:hypothetical protein